MCSGGVCRTLLPESSPLGGAWISVRKLLTQESVRTWIRTKAFWAQMLTKPCFLSLWFLALPPCSSVPFGLAENSLWTRGWQTPFDGEHPKAQDAGSFYSSSCTAVATGSCPGVKKWGQSFSFSQRENNPKYKWTALGHLNLYFPSCPGLKSTL